MKKLLYGILMLFTLGLNFQPVNALDASLYGEKMHVDMYVHDDGLVDVNTTIDMYFNRPMQGIFVELPIKYSGYDFSGLTHNALDKNRTYYFPVSDFKSSTHQYEEDSSGTAGVVYRLGTAGKYLQGPQTFEYSYKIQMRDLELSNNKDYFFMNLLGDRWEFPFEAFSFRVEFEKPIDGKSIQIQMKDNQPVLFEYEDHVISGQVDEIFYSGDPLTMLVDLDTGYFNFKNYDYTLYGLVGSLVALGLVIFIYSRHGKKYPVVDSVEFTAPEGLNSADVGYVYHGHYSNEGIISLIIYWASKGYILIEEMDKKNIRLHKLMDMKFGNEEEIRLFNGLFGSKEMVLIKDLENRFYTYIQYAIQHMPTKFENNKIYDTTSKWMENLALAILSMVIGVFIGTLTYKIYGMPIIFVIAMGIGFVFGYVMLLIIADIIFKSKNKGFIKKTGNLFLIGILLFVMGSVVWFVSVMYRFNLYILMGTILLWLIGVMVAVRIRRRTEYGASVYGQVLGLKRFIDTAEKHRLEMLVEESPEIFYDVLPYAYVLGVSDKWSKKFENIAIQQPDWYVSATPGNFNSYLLWRSLSRNMSTMNSTMTSIPQSKGSSGGGFSGGSGGGFSGGGFGGGGGGGW